MTTRYVWLEGRQPYDATLVLQETLVAERAADRIPNVVLFLEHEPVITVGRARGADDNVLDAAQIPVTRISRGGDVTWHGPGQLVAYPIVALQGERADLHLHLRSIEDAVIGLLRELGLHPTRDTRNTGVWLPDDDPLPKKVCSVGIGCKRWVTWHGLALNVSTDPNVWQRLRPCGFGADVMTRLDDHMHHTPPLGRLAQQLAQHLATSLDLGPPDDWHVAHQATLEAVLGRPSPEKP